MQYCVAEDTLEGTFTSSKGNIAFGGAESVFQDFTPNHYIRSDATIPAGTYEFTAFHTDIPDEIVTQATRVERSSAELWLLRAPMVITLTSIGIAFAFAALRHFEFTGLVLILGYLAFKAVKRLQAYKVLVARREEAQLNFPSMVIQMRSPPPSSGR